jgi:hypothetical protein
VSIDGEMIGTKGLAFNVAPTGVVTIAGGSMFMNRDPAKVN